MSKEEITKILLDDLQKKDKIDNTLTWCKEHDIVHNTLVGIIKSLESNFVFFFRGYLIFFFFSFSLSIRLSNWFKRALKNGI